jgi:hypothetical protein
MAGFEVLIRPVVFPNIRPTPARILPPLDDPEQGKFVFGFGSIKTMGTSFSWTVNVSRQKPQEEIAREFDKERVYQKDDKGKINKNNFIDVERMKKFKATGVEGRDDELRVAFADPPDVDNVKVIQTNITRRADE